MLEWGGSLSLASQQRYHGRHEHDEKRSNEDRCTYAHGCGRVVGAVRRDTPDESDDNTTENHADRHEKGIECLVLHSVTHPPGLGWKSTNEDSYTLIYI